MSQIEVTGLSKRFKLGQATSLRDNLQRGWAMVRGAEPPERPHFKALDNLDFRVEAGEVLGIIGTNGAGKSTLLKILAGISVPTSGSVRVRGRIAPLIEVGAGLIGDLSGRENIYLNGIILGMSHRDIRRKLDEIVAFAELEKFLDTPLKRYSSGMAVRLGFAIATSVDADILIVDEVLAVGDLAFQRKCFDRMEDMIRGQGKTVILVSHNTRQVERLCNRVLLLDHGKVLADDAPSKVCELFYRRSNELVRNAAVSSPGSRWGNTQESDELKLEELALVGPDGLDTHVITYRTNFKVRLRVNVMAELHKPTFGIGVHTTDFLYITTQNSEQQLRIGTLSPGRYDIICDIADCPLLPGVYALRLGISEGTASRGVFYGENLLHFQVVSNADRPLSEANSHGFFALEARWHPPHTAPSEGRQEPNQVTDLMSL